MSVWAVTMVKNEQDVIEAVIRHLLAEGVDHVLVADNMSTDDTRPILNRLAETLPLTVVDDTEPAYFQSAKMTGLANLAEAQGAEWVVPFDADELWVSTDGRRLADVLRASTDADVLHAEWYDRVPPLLPHRSPWAQSRRARQPHVLDKVAFRPRPDVTVDQGNHDVTGPSDLRRVRGRIVVHHFRWRGFGHFVEKNRKGKVAMDAAGSAISQWSSQHWRRYGGRSAVRLVPSYVRLVWTARRAGTVRDPVRPGHGPQDMTP